MASLMDELQARGFVEQLSDPALGKWLEENRGTIYAGFDPTSDSLHLGHLVPIMAMAHFQRCGHRVLALVGGATGMVGDPSGRSDERNLLTAADVAANAAAVRQQMSAFLDFEGDNAAVMLDNNDWIGAMSFVEWLRDVGKFFTVNYMLAKESVKARLGAEAGISFTEFSYMTMQAYDFLHLFREYGCTIQGGGNDQWGNITAGIDLVRKATGAQVYGVTFPLIATSTGEKFGKTAGNAVWLDPDRTSPYQFYQYWVRTADDDVDRFLKLFTFLDLDEIASISDTHRRAPERREAQKRLAGEATRLVHGDAGLDAARSASEALFGGNLAGLSDRDLLDVFADAPSTQLSTGELAAGINVVDLFARTALTSSKSDARRAIKQGGAYLNNERISDSELTVNASHLLGRSILVLRKGKKNYHLVQAV